MQNTHRMKRLPVKINGPLIVFGTALDMDLFRVAVCTEERLAVYLLWPFNIG